MNNITNDQEFDKMKDSLCPQCYFQDNKEIIRKDCPHFIKVLLFRIDKFKEALIWCSGSDDFQLGGKAREGWEKLCLPLLEIK